MIDLYIFRFHWLFRVCRFIQNSMDVSKEHICGIDADIIFHFLIAVFLYFILLLFFSCKKSLIIVLILIFLKELNDFYVIYYYKDIRLKFILSGIRDIICSGAGVTIVFFMSKYIKAFLDRKKKNN